MKAIAHGVGFHKGFYKGNEGNRPQGGLLERHGTNRLQTDSCEGSLGQGLTIDLQSKLRNHLQFKLAA
jgi:hypothetical protein